MEDIKKHKREPHLHGIESILEHLMSDDAAVKAFGVFDDSEHDTNLSLELAYEAAGKCKRVELTEINVTQTYRVESRMTAVRLVGASSARSLRMVLWNATAKTTKIMMKSCCIPTPPM